MIIEIITKSYAIPMIEMIFLNYHKVIYEQCLCFEMTTEIIKRLYAMLGLRNDY